MADFIPLKDIKVLPGRQRKKFSGEALADLAQSIQDDGLLNAVCLRKGEDVLVAGERRLRAISLLYSMGGKFSYNNEEVPLDQVPYTRISAEEEAKIYAAELVENLQRESLTVQEEMAAIARLHELREMNNPKQTFRDTATELNDYEEPSSAAVSKVRDAVLITKYKDHPQVKAAKTVSHAKKAVEKILNTEHKKKLTEEFQIKSAEEKEHKHIALNGDAFELMAKMPNHCVDVVLTDPIYGINAQNFGSQTAVGHQYDDSYETWKRDMPVLASELFRLCKSQAHAYLFCAYERFEELKGYFQKAGWEVWRKPLIWYKGVSVGMLPYPDHGPRYTYECILFASKGKKKTQKVGPDCLDIPGVFRPRHAAEKPAQLYVELLERSALPGDHVLDCFFGSGPIFPAANYCNVKVTAFELDKVSFADGIQRLDEYPSAQEKQQEAVEVNLDTLFGE